MVEKNKPQTLKGFRDFLPGEARLRGFVLKKIKEVFESFGFEPLETPSLEYAETLLGKYGEEADRLIYTFNDRGNRRVGLIYDLTVSASRVLAQYGQKIPLPFKRYQIQRVWRAEKPQKGRYREFLQCDVDIFGAASPLADAEIIALTYEALRRIGFEKFSIKINSRQVLFQILEKVGIAEKARQLSLLRTVDKLDKRGREVVQEELLEQGFSKAEVENAFRYLESAEPDTSLRSVLCLVRDLGVPERFFKFDPTLVRGLDYYTGAIFETKIEEPKLGSLTGGGRYDKLVSQLGGPDIPATGMTIGLDRIVSAAGELGLFQGELEPPSEALVTIFPERGKESNLKEPLEIARRLRREGVRTEIYLNPGAPLEKELRYANKKGIPYAIILGPEEIKMGKVILKDMETGEQKLLPPEELGGEILAGLRKPQGG